MKMLTIYTPTYNRKSLLPRVYESLCQQKSKEFIWLIIDDGSTDGTTELVSSWMQIDYGFEIRYCYKKNGGVHTARDVAYSMCETELITSVDSDDWISDDAVSSITDFWKANNGSKFAGIIYPTFDSDGKEICKNYPIVSFATYQDFTFKYKCRGDMHTVLRTDIIKEIPSLPAFEGENLVGENCKWIQIPEDKPFLLSEKHIFFVEYQNDGLSVTINSNRVKNLNGFRATEKQLLISCKYVKPRIRAQIKYIAYSILLRDREYIKNSPKPMGTFFLTPIGWVASIFIKHAANK